VKRGRVGDNLAVVRIFLPCLALAAALLAPGLLVGPSLDAAVFAEVADRMRAGATLYVDVWDHKPPGMYLLLLSGQMLLPWLRPWLVSWLLSVLATAGTATLIHGICRRLGLSSMAAWVAAVGALVVTGQFLTALGGGLTEPFAALLLAGAQQLALRSWGRERAAVPAAFAGVLMALAMLLSVQAAPALLPIGWLLAAGSRSIIRRLAWAAAGFVAPLAACAAWLAAIGALDGAADAVVTYTGAYRAVASATGAALAGPVMAWTLLALLFLAIPAAMGVVEARRQPGPARDLSVACLAWIALTLASFVVQGRLFGHYVIPLAIPLGVLAAFGAERLRALPTGQRSRLLLPILATCLVSAMAAGVAGAMELEPISVDHERSLLAATTIDMSSDADDPILVWGNEPELYLDSDRASTTPYLYLYALVTPGYATPQLIRQTLDALEGRPPKLIVDAGSSAPGQPGFQALLIPRPLASDGRDLDLLDPLRAFVRDSYREISREGGWVVYARRDAAADDDGRASSQLRLAATRR
jgi:hypothetical protein